MNIPYSSCNLGSLNLFKFVKNNQFDWISLSKYFICSKILDNMISVNKLPLLKIQEVTKIRPIGLGTWISRCFICVRYSMNSKRAYLYR